MCSVILWWWRPRGRGVVPLLNSQGKLVSGKALERFLLKPFSDCPGKHITIFVWTGGCCTICYQMIRCMKQTILCPSLNIKWVDGRTADSGLHFAAAGRNYWVLLLRASQCFGWSAIWCEVSACYERFKALVTFLKKFLVSFRENLQHL